MNLMNMEPIVPSIRDGIVAKLKEEISERQGIVDVLEGDRFEKFRAIYAKKQAAAMEQSINAQAEALYGASPTHGDAIAEVRKRGRKAKQSPEDLREPMIAFVRKHPGCKAEQIREAIGAKPTQMPVLRVLTSHAVRTKGAKRATTYWPKAGAK